MKSKLLSIILAVISCFVFVAGLTACGDGEQADDIKVTDITLNKTTLALDVGDIEMLVATVSPDNATDKTVTWQSSDPAVATVVDGRVSALKEGTAAIAATAGDKIAMCTVTVMQMSLNKSSLVLEEGDSQTLNIISASLTSDTSVTWESSDSTVATVEDGVVTAVKKGIATITATVESKVAMCAVTVTEKKAPHVDYAGQVKLDFSNGTKKQEVTVLRFIDGDSTYFTPVQNSTYLGCDNASDFSATADGYVNARYLAINTPEITGVPEEWGRAAAEFTQDKLESAEAIIIESDDETWNLDSTGARYMLWVWYIPAGETEFRNLNIEILQTGLAYAANTADNRYGEYAQAALEQAKAEKLYIYSGEPDPDYYYGELIYTTLKELRFNAEQYVYNRIVVEGLVVANFDNTAYIEDLYYDIEGYEDGIRIGMPVYYGFATGEVVDVILQPGNYVKVVGTLIYYETGGYYQIVGIDHKSLEPDNPDNCKIIEKMGLDSAYAEIDAADFASTDLKVGVDVNKVDEYDNAYVETVSMSYVQAILGTSVTLCSLTVYDIYTTTNQDSRSYGANTLYCADSSGNEIVIRTNPFRDTDGNIIMGNAYVNKTITVKGIVEMYVNQHTGDITYQIKCFEQNCITVL